MGFDKELLKQRHLSGIAIPFKRGDDFDLIRPIALHFLRRNPFLKGVPEGDPGWERLSRQSMGRVIKLLI